MIVVLHVITGLRQGGAEQALARLVTNSDRSRFRHIVAPLRDGGAWDAPLRAAGVDVAPLHFNGALDFLAARARLRKLIAAAKPDIVQSWLYHADLLATLSKPAGSRLAWNLRNSDLAASGRGSWTLLVGALAALSQRPDLIISNSEAGLKAHIARGYRPRKSLVIPNGVDVSAFKPAPESRAATRARLGLPADKFLIGMPARYEGFKDHTTFVEAARLAHASGFNGAFVLAGEGVDARNTHLKDMLDAAQLRDRVHILPPQNDMPALYAALDLVTLSSSHGEGFPNVIAEAMACGTPVVATDVGDVRAMLGETGAIVAPRSPQALADAWLKTAALPPNAWAELGEKGRARVDARYSLAAMIAAYESAYSALAGV